MGKRSAKDWSSCSIFRLSDNSVMKNINTPLTEYEMESSYRMTICGMGFGHVGWALRSYTDTPLHTDRCRGWSAHNQQAAWSKERRKLAERTSGYKSAKQLSRPAKNRRTADGNILLIRRGEGGSEISHSAWKKDRTVAIYGQPQNPKVELSPPLKIM